MKFLAILCTLALFSETYEIDASRFRGRKTPVVGMHPAIYCKPLEKMPEVPCAYRGYSQVVLKNRSNEGVGFDKGYSTLELFLAPVKPDTAIPYLDLRGHMFNNAKEWAANGGLGVRIPAFGFLFGSNMYYDYRSGIQQLSGGLELISTYVNLTLNGYLPTSSGLPYMNFDFTSTIPFGCTNSYCTLTLGTYYLFNESKVGGKGELTLQISRWFSLGGCYTYDAVFKSRANGFAALHFSFGKTERDEKNNSTCSRFCWKQRQKTTLPYHNEIIVKSP